MNVNNISKSFTQAVQISAQKEPCAVLVRAGHVVEGEDILGKVDIKEVCIQSGLH
jgi:hypothetical protein